MAEIVLKIPEEFEQDFNADRFRECFMRVLFDCKAWDYAGISGNYEHETLDMIVKAFNEAVVLPKGHGRMIDADELIKKGHVTESYINTFTETIIEADMEEKDESVS